MLMVTDLLTETSHIGRHLGFCCGSPAGVSLWPPSKITVWDQSDWSHTVVFGQSLTIIVTQTLFSTCYMHSALLSVSHKMMNLRGSFWILYYISLQLVIQQSCIVYQIVH